MDCQRLKELYVQNDSKEITNLATKLAQDLCEKNIKIVELIAALKDLLTSLEKDDRFYAVSFLALILENLDPNFMNGEEIKCILDFFIDRTKDDVKILGPVFRSFITMNTYPMFTFENAQRILHLLQHDISNQICSSETLECMYRLFQKLFERFNSDFIAAGSRFVYAFLSIVDGETNSSVLRQVFELYRIIASVEEFNPFKEDIFEAMAGYFPIIYSKESDPKLLEVKNSIQDALIIALCSDSICSKYALSLALEKMDSVSIYSKISSYCLLSVAFTNLIQATGNLNSYYNEIWTNIRIDSLKTPTDEDEQELRDAALETLRVMGSNFYYSPDDTTTFFEKIWSDLRVALYFPNLKLVLSATDILITFAQDSYLFQEFYYEKTVELLFDRYLASAEPEEKTDYLTAMSRVFAERNFYQEFAKEERIINDFFPRIMQEMLTSSDTKSIGSLCSALFNCWKFLNFDNLVPKFCDFLKNIRKLPDFFVLIEHYCKCIAIFCEKQPFKMTKYFVDPLMDEMVAYSESPNFIFDAQAELDIEVLLTTAKQPSIFMCVWDFALQYYKKLSSTTDKNRYLLLLLSVFTEDKYDVFFPESRRQMYNLMPDKFAPQLFEMIFDEVFIERSDIQTLIFYKFNFFLRALIYFCPVFSKDHIFDDLFFSKNLTKLVFGRKVYEPLDFKTMSESQLKFYHLILNAYLRDSCQYSHISISDMLNVILNDIDIISHLQLEDSPSLYSIIGNNLLNILSTLPDKSDFIPQTKPILDFIEQRPHLEKSYIKLELLTTLLVSAQRSSPNFSNDLFDMLLDSLDDSNYHSSISSKITRKYSDLSMSDSYGTLFLNRFKNLDNSQIEPHTPTRFSQQFADKIFKKYSETRHCSMFMFLMEYYQLAPKYIFEDDSDLEGQSFLNNFIPVILEGLERFVDETQAAVDCLTLLRRILPFNQKLLEPYLLRISKTCINCSLNAKSLRTRREALLFMVDMVQQFKENPILIAQKGELFTIIRPTLSDPKRLVRTVAANLNLRLCMLGQPGN